MTTQPETPSAALPPFNPPRAVREIWTPEVVRRTVADASMSVAACTAAVIVVKHAARFFEFTGRDTTMLLLQRKLYKF